MIFQYEEDGKRMAKKVMPGYEPFVLARILLEKSTKIIHAWDPTKAKPIHWVIRLNEAGELKLTGWPMNL